MVVKQTHTTEFIMIPKQRRLAESTERPLLTFLQKFSKKIPDCLKFLDIDHSLRDCELIFLLMILDEKLSTVFTRGACEKTLIVKVRIIYPTCE